MNQKINYSAFNDKQELLTGDVQKQVLAVGSFVAGALLFLAVLKGFSFGIVIFLVSVTAMMTVFIVRGFLFNSDKKIKKFINDNSWQMSFVMPEKIPKSINLTNNLGRKSIKGTIDGVDFNLFLYEQSSNRNDFNKFSILKFYTNKDLPELLLDSKQSYELLRLPVDSQLIELEGNFHKKYKLYVADKNRIDALSFITPDVMHKLIDTSLVVDIEFSDNSINFIVEGDIYVSNNIENFIEAIRVVMSDFSHKLRSYNPSDRTATLSYNSNSLINSAYADNRKSFKARNPFNNKIFLYIAIFFVIIFIIQVIWIFSNFISLSNEVGL